MFKLAGGHISVYETDHPNAIRDCGRVSFVELALRIFESPVSFRFGFAFEYARGRGRGVG